MKKIILLILAFNLANAKALPIPIKKIMNQCVTLKAIILSRAGDKILKEEAFEKYSEMGCIELETIGTTVEPANIRG